MIPLSVISAATQSHKRFFPYGPFVSVILAQWILESNWGRLPSGKNNYFGIKARADQVARGEFTDRWTHEVLPSGQSVKMVQRFANYNSIGAGFDAHADLLTSAHYYAAQHEQTVNEYCIALQHAGYATDPKYASKLIDLINKYNLKQYDPRSLA